MTASSAFATGGAQPLSNGGMFVAWGTVPQITEYNAAGDIVFDATLPPGGFFNYRSSKTKWAGNPQDRPAIASEADGPGATVYASWNGATKIRTWKVFTGTDENSLTEAAESKWTGLETAIAIPAAGANVKVVAYDGARATSSVNPDSWPSASSPADQQPGRNGPERRFNRKGPSRGPFCCRAEREAPVRPGDGPVLHGPPAAVHPSDSPIDRLGQVGGAPRAVILVGAAVAVTECPGLAGVTTQQVELRSITTGFTGPGAAVAAATGSGSGRGQDPAPEFRGVGLPSTDSDAGQRRCGGLEAGAVGREVLLHGDAGVVTDALAVG